MGWPSRKTWMYIGEAVLGQINPSILRAEQEIVAGIKAQGAERKAHVMEAALAAAEGADALIGKDVMDDKQVKELTGKIIDLQVELHDAIAKAADAAKAPPVDETTGSAKTTASAKAAAAAEKTKH